MPAKKPAADATAIDISAPAPVGKRKAAPKKEKAIPPKRVIDLLPEGEELAMSLFFAPLALPKKPQGQKAFRLGIERLAMAPVAALRIDSRQYAAHADSMPEQCWAVSALALAARLSFNELRTLACFAGSLAEEDWAERAAQAAHRLFRSGGHRGYRRQEKEELPRAFGELWTDLARAAGVSDQEIRGLGRGNNASAGRHGWMARAECSVRHGPRSWKEKNCEAIAKKMDTRRWGIVLARAVTDADKLSAWPSSMRDFHAQLHADFEPAAQAFWEAGVLRAEFAEAKLAQQALDGVSGASPSAAVETQATKRVAPRL